MKKLFLLSTLFVFGSLSIAAQTPESSIKPIIGGVLNGKATNLVKPAYPPAARAVNAGGAVNVQVLIDEEGNVVSASAASGHPLLRIASEQAALSSKFSPIKLSGQPVKVSGVIVYKFVAPEDENGYEKKLGIMGLAAYLKIAEILPESDWEGFTQSNLSELTEISKELAPLATITRETPKETRVEIIRQVIGSLETELKGTDAWQFSFGKAFADFLFEIKRIEAGSGQTQNETLLKTKLAKIKELNSKAPVDFPAEVKEKFKVLSDFSEAENLSAPENISKLLEIVGDIFQIISPDLVK